MDYYKTIHKKLQKNLTILRRREAKGAGQAPPDLLNQITDHQKALALTG